MDNTYSQEFSKYQKAQSLSENLVIFEDFDDH